MDSSVRIGSDVIAYEDSTPETIIIQLKAMLRELHLFHQRKARVIHDKMESSKKILEEAYRQWYELQNNLTIELDIIMSRKEYDIGTLKQKIARYRILNEYGSEICIKSYQLAKETDETGDYGILKVESENEVLIYQIAYDLIQGKLGMWPSDDIDLWFDFAQMSQISGQPILSNFTQSLISNNKLTDESPTND